MPAIFLVVSPGYCLRSTSFSYFNVLSVALYPIYLIVFLSDVVTMTMVYSQNLYSVWSIEIEKTFIIYIYHTYTTTSRNYR